MLCKNQEHSDEPCPSGLSRKIKCGLGHDSECMNLCNHSCSDFVPETPAIEFEPPKKKQYAPKQYNHHAMPTRNGSGCGGCGKNISY